MRKAVFMYDGEKAIIWIKRPACIRNLMLLIIGTQKGDSKNMLILNSFIAVGWTTAKIL